MQDLFLTNGGSTIFTMKWISSKWHCGDLRGIVHWCFPFIYSRGVCWGLDCNNSDRFFLNSNTCILTECKWHVANFNGPLTRYVKLRVAHAPGMPERFPRHRLQRKPLFSDPPPPPPPPPPPMHHGMCMSGSLTHGGGENVPGIPGACATRNFTSRGLFHN